MNTQSGLEYSTDQDGQHTPSSNDNQTSMALLKRLLYPRSIALVGASERSPWSRLLHANIRRVGFEGQVFAINKTGAAAHGYPGYQSCRDLPGEVDAAYLLVPLDAVLDAFDDAIAAGIRSMVILTSGFAESGAEGAQLQQQLVNRAPPLARCFWGQTAWALPI